VKWLKSGQAGHLMASSTAWGHDCAKYITKALQLLCLLTSQSADGESMTEEFSLEGVAYLICLETVSCRGRFPMVMYISTITYNWPVCLGTWNVYTIIKGLRELTTILL